MAMSDPRYTDPNRDSQFSDPVLRRSQSVDRMWGWIAGIAVVVLIGFILIAGWNSNSSSTASNPGAAPPASTTGLGSPTPPRASPMAPTAPSPAAPPPRGGTQ
jgi:hypothetical protein